MKKIVIVVLVALTLQVSPALAKGQPQIPPPLLEIWPEEVSQSRYFFLPTLTILYSTDVVFNETTELTCEAMNPLVKIVKDEDTMYVLWLVRPKWQYNELEAEVTAHSLVQSTAGLDLYQEAYGSIILKPFLLILKE